MKAKLLISNKEIEVEISEEELKNLSLQSEYKKTGYERVDIGGNYYCDNHGCALSLIEDNVNFDQLLYRNANYYSSEIVAENNARADTLMRQLRRFAVEHRKKDIDWNNSDTYKYSIRYGYSTIGKNEVLDIFTEILGRDFGQIYFDSEETAQLAIDTFYDELVWYFTKYKDSL